MCQRNAVSIIFSDGSEAAFYTDKAIKEIALQAKSTLIWAY